MPIHHLPPVCPSESHASSSSSPSGWDAMKFRRSVQQKWSGGKWWMRVMWKLFKGAILSEAVANLPLEHQMEYLKQMSLERMDQDCLEVLQSAQPLHFIPLGRPVRVERRRYAKMRLVKDHPKDSVLLVHDGIGWEPKLERSVTSSSATTEQLSGLTGDSISSLNRTRLRKKSGSRRTKK